MPILPASPVLASGLRFGFDHLSEAGFVIAGLLVVMSILCWAVMVSKLWLLGRTRKANAAFLHAFHESPHPLALFQERRHHEHSPLYHVYHAASRELAFHLLGTDEPDSTFSSRLNSAARITQSQMNAVETAIKRANEETSVRLEARMKGVAMALNAAPFIGVLGTVWGLMDSLADLAVETGNITLQMAAPGACAALLSSVIGLLVAVPGMFGFHFISRHIRALLLRQEHFASEFCSIIGRHFVDHRPVAEELPSIGSLITPNMPAFGMPAGRTAAAPKS